MRLLPVNNFLAGEFFTDEQTFSPARDSLVNTGKFAGEYQKLTNWPFAAYLALFLYKEAFKFNILFNMNIFK